MYSKRKKNCKSKRLLDSFKATCSSGGFSFTVTDQNQTPSIEKLKTESLWTDLEKEGPTEGVFLLDYDLDFNDIGTAFLQNNSRLIKTLIGDGLLYPPTREEIEYFIDHDIVLTTLKFESHILIQSKTKI